MALQNPLTAAAASAAVTSTDSGVKSQRRRQPMTMMKPNPAPLLPVLPPLAPRREASYPKAVQAAPFTALRAMLVYDDEPEPHQVTPKCRLRTQVRTTTI